ncbi:MAG TPA: ribosomal-processing cysteine protease Prp [Thermoanaerobacterales bacterium]|uniref:ribosomal-processing cysteine protease Prp n=1 Tax=Tepidanaerobacter sp. GT38 TaxID=2722793 RepID=UPI00184F4DA0|nr:ribosomal-processing cysteine protease Prp [Tepidanaerobacter sp. GT38]MCG1012784.1 ribosomal-processing cysteine protease Prp [Tepidanaerobacter sp. GT38]HHY41862.1 ribosomal-processing cysteine protease Prp [Thermoanaerobacterales bacterium]
MIHVKAKRHPIGGYMSLEISGHAKYAEYGKDIVCAGVSALAETAILGLKHVACVKPLVIKRQGYLALKLPDNLPQEELKKATIILETIFLGLKDISKSYPSNVRIELVEEVE